MPLPIGSEMPSFDGATGWFNGPVSPDALKGYPVLVQFWAASCPACKVGMPRLFQLERDYAEHGLRLVSVHLPRMPSDRDAAKVQTLAEELGIKGPCALDNDEIVGKNFQTQGMWPSYFFFDAEGRMRSRAAGEMGLKIAENSLKRILQADRSRTQLTANE